jgi:diguanylate cyclase (GGDEF)-like protein/PAS domain S-box-containing protein
MPPRRASVVLVEDSAAYATLVSLILTDALGVEVEVRHHERLAPAVADLRERDADCILLDLSLPDAQELEGLATLAAAGIRAPIVVLSGHDDDELAEAAVAAGAQDYLVKGQERPPARFGRIIRLAIARRHAKERDEDLLRAREDRWRTLTHLAPVGIVELGPDGRCIFANDAMAELTGRPVEALVGSTLRQVVHPEDVEPFDAASQAALDGDGELVLEVRFVRPQHGEVVWANVTAVLQRDPYYGPAGWLAAFVDVTAARRAREDLVAVAELARDVSVLDADPVPQLLEGGRRLLGAASLELRDAGPPGEGLREAVRRGEETIGELAVVFAGGREPDERDRTIVRLLASEVGAALERGRLLGELRSLARTDPLTGLANRRLWDERLEVELLRAERYGRPLCMAAIDLDHFKAYNDRYGHQRGDALLRDTTAAWRGALRGVDLLARWGGDEFALLLPDCDLAAARRIVERLGALTGDAIACSAGLVAWRAPSETGAELLARADAALYAAKAAGRGGIVTG